MASAYADVEPTPSPVFGTGIFISAGGWNPGSANENGGGAFTGYISTPGTTDLANNTTFWCVDDELFFSPVEYGYANITPISAVASAPANTVRYSGVTNGSSNSAGNWTNQTVDLGGAGPVTLPDSAQARYQMEAFLVSNYTPSPMVPDGRGQNSAIQDAIWAITNNSAPGAENSGFATISGNVTDSTTVAYWVNQALINYAGVNSNDWGVVSWAVDGTQGADFGQLLPGNYGASGENQTFLVELNGGDVPPGNPQLGLTPEPGYYAPLGIGLSGLLFLRARRKKK